MLDATHRASLPVVSLCTQVANLQGDAFGTPVGGPAFRKQKLFQDKFAVQGATGAPQTRHAISPSLVSRSGFSSYDLI